MGGEPLSLRKAVSGKESLLTKYPHVHDAYFIGKKTSRTHLVNEFLFGFINQRMPSANVLFFEMCSNFCWVASRLLLEHIDVDAVVRTNANAHWLRRRRKQRASACFLEALLIQNPTNPPRGVQPGSIDV